MVCDYIARSPWGWGFHIPITTFAPTILLLGFYRRSSICAPRASPSNPTSSSALSPAQGLGSGPSPAVLPTGVFTFYQITRNSIKTCCDFSHPMNQNKKEKPARSLFSQQRLFYFFALLRSKTGVTQAHALISSHALTHPLKSGSCSLNSSKAAPRERIAKSLVNPWSSSYLTSHQHLTQVTTDSSMRHFLQLASRTRWSFWVPPCRA